MDGEFISAAASQGRKARPRKAQWTHEAIASPVISGRPQGRSQPTTRWARLLKVGSQKAKPPPRCAVGSLVLNSAQSCAGPHTGRAPLPPRDLSIFEHGPQVGLHEHLTQAFMCSAVSAPRAWSPSDHGLHVLTQICIFQCGSRLGVGLWRVSTTRFHDTRMASDQRAFDDIMPPHLPASAPGGLGVPDYHTVPAVLVV